VLRALATTVLAVLALSATDAVAHIKVPAVLGDELRRVDQLTPVPILLPSTFPIRETKASTPLGAAAGGGGGSS
jgi:hypothetical protein